MTGAVVVAVEIEAVEMPPQPIECWSHKLLLLLNAESVGVESVEFAPAEVESAGAGPTDRFRGQSLDLDLKHLV